MDRIKAPQKYSKNDEQLASFAKAIAHPVRIKILRLLSNQPSCYTGDLTKEIALAQSTISQHLKTLKSAGLIQGEIVPPKVKYCLNKENWLLAKLLFEEIFITD